MHTNCVRTETENNRHSMTTIHDVARLAGVSIKTVSRVVNGESNVRPSTKKRVQAAIEEIDFTPHLGARSMRSKRTGLVAMITGGIFAEGWVPFRTGLSTIPIVNGTQQSLRDDGKILLFADTFGSEEEFRDLVQLFRAHRVEGMVYSSTFHRKVSIACRIPFPLVLVNCFDDRATPSIVPNDELAQFMVAEDMINDGHRSVALVGLPESIMAGRLRRNGFFRAAKQFGLPNSHTQFAEGIQTDGKREVNVLEPALAEIFGSTSRPTGICFGNDLMAMRALPILHQMGIRPGEDIAVWGFDNDPTICNSVHPSLTTISLPYQEMGIAAAQTLINLIGGETSPSKQQICGKIIKRESSRLN